MAKHNAVIGQSGGPTSVINASLAGVMEAVAGHDEIGTLFGMRGAIEGLLHEDFHNLSSESDRTIRGLLATPSSALGSSRHKLTDDDLPKIKEILERHDIRYFFLIGGNDTMDTIHRVENYCRENGYELFAVGIPKTVDNDLYGTDYTPGFPSAARYNMLSVQQAGRLARDMRNVDRFTIYQTIGRDAGWLAASTAAARRSEVDPPHLIYCPERVFQKDEFLKDAKDWIDGIGYVSIVVSEGIKYGNGMPVSAATDTDSFKNVEYGAMGGASVGMRIHRMLADETGFRGEFQVTESLPMCAIDRAVSEDIQRAREAGAAAVGMACSGESGWMVSIERSSDSQPIFTFGRTELEQVAIRAKAMPDEFINARGNHVTELFLDYVKPLIGSIPEYVSLGEKS